MYCNSKSTSVPTSYKFYNLLCASLWVAVVIFTAVNYSLSAEYRTEHDCDSAVGYCSLQDDHCSENIFILYTLLNSDTGNGTMGASCHLWVYCVVIHVSHDDLGLLHIPKSYMDRAI